MQSWGRYQQINLNHNIQTCFNTIIPIEQALNDDQLNSIRAFIIKINESTNYENQNTQCSSTFILVADESTSTYLLVTDLSPNTIRQEHSYIITKARRKNFNGMVILTTTIESSISLSDKAVDPNVQNVEHLLNFDLTYIKTLTTTISEITGIRRIFNCGICTGTLEHVRDAPVLLQCSKCKRYSLERNNIQSMSTSIILNNNNQKINLTVNHKVFTKLINTTGTTLDMNEHQIIVSLISHGNLVYKYNEFTKELLDVTTV